MILPLEVVTTPSSLLGMLVSYCGDCTIGTSVTAGAFARAVDVQIHDVALEPVPIALGMVDISVACYHHFCQKCV